MSAQLSLAYSRSSDPASSRNGVRKARTGSQKATILGLLLMWSEAWGPENVAVTADMLHERHPHTQRSVWSTRLSAMARPEVGLLSKDETTDPICFSLTAEGLTEARRLKAS